MAVDNDFLRDIGFNMGTAGNTAEPGSVTANGSSGISIGGTDYALDGVSALSGATVDEEGNLSISNSGLADLSIITQNYYDTADSITYEETGEVDENGKPVVRVIVDGKDMADFYEDNDLNVLSNVYDPLSVDQSILDNEDALEQWSINKATQLNAGTGQFNTYFGPDGFASEKHPLWDSLGKGWQDVKQNYWALDAKLWHELGLEDYKADSAVGQFLIGDETFAENAQQRQALANFRAQQYTYINQQWDQVDLWSPSSVYEYVAGLAGGSAPTLGILATGAALSPFTGGASLTAATGFNFINHTGNALREQGESPVDQQLISAAFAGVVNTGLEKLGLRGIGKAFNPISLTTKAGRSGLVKQFVSKYGISAASASTLVAGIVAEGLTEATQELVTIGAGYSAGREYEIPEIRERVISSGIGGAVAGGAFSVAGSAARASRNLAVSKQKKWDNKQATDRIMKGLTGVSTETTETSANNLNNQLASKLGEETANAGFDYDIDNTDPVDPREVALKKLNDEYEKVSLDEEATWMKSLAGFDRDPVGAVRRVWDNVTREPAIAILNQLDRDKVPMSERVELYKAMKMYLETDERVGVGYDFSRTASVVGGRYLSMVATNKALLAKSLNVSPKKADAIFKAYIEYRKNPDNYTGLYREYFNNPVLDKVYNNMVEILKHADNDNKRLIPGYQGVDNYIAQMFQLDKNKVRKNRDQFAKYLAEERGEFFKDTADINSFIEAVVDSKDTVTPDAVAREFLSKSGGLKRKGNLDLGNTSKIKAEFGRDDVFDAFAEGINNNVRFAYQKRFVGDNNIVLRTALANAREQMGDKWRPEYGVFIETSADRHTHRKDIPRELKIINSWLGSFNVAIYLEAALISSFPELAVSTHKAGSLTDRVAALMLEQKEVKEMQEALDLLPDTMYGSIDGDATTNAGSTLLKQTRAYQQHGGATSKDDFDSQYAPHLLQQINNLTMMPLAKYTNYTRMVNLNIGKTSIASDLMMLSGITSLTGGQLTNAQAASARNLQELGLDPVLSADMYKRWTEMSAEIVAGFPIDPESSMEVQAEQQRKQMQIRDESLAADPEMAQFLQSLNAANIVFAEQSIVFPSVSNRPLFYSNPYLKFATTFLGFVSTFTNKALPKLWRDFRGQSGPLAQYHTFQTVALMLMIAGLGNALKEELFHGGEGYDDTTGKRLRSMVEASGLLGIYGKPLAVLFPKFDEGHGLGRRVLDEALGVNKATLDKGIQVFDAAWQGDSERAGYHASSFIPFVGNVRSWREDLSGYELRR